MQRDIERLITEPLEDKLKNLSNVVEIFYKVITYLP
jgi:hypothetical protein